MVASSVAQRPAAAHRAAAAVTAFLLSGVAGPGHAQLAPIFVVPTESRVAAPVAAGEPLQLHLYGHDIGALARALRVAEPGPGATHLDYTLREYPGSAPASERSWLEPSFVIDFDQPAVASLYDELRQSGAGPYSRAQLVQFVARVVDESPGRGWDVASRIAMRRDGDCTEHAVLLTALARRAAIPARVVLGVAIVQTDGGYASYGHAWSELREEGRWVVADAALTGLEAPVRYLPLGVLEQEGPGFFVSAAAFMQHWVQRVVVLGVAN
jgi:transglutaminase-like putative cysteine protease